MARTRKPCQRCGGEKPAGRGIRFCDACLQEPGKRKHVGPSRCRDCGGLEGKQPGQQLCDDCKELARWRRARRKKATGRKPCLRCRRPKGEGKRRRLCDRCRAETARGPQCRKCKKQPIRRKFAQLCTDCARESAERVRERQRLYQARLRADPVRREEIRERAREKWARRQQNKATRERDLETRRLRYHAKRGPRPVDPVERQSHGDWRISAPGRPLAAVLDRLAVREALRGLGGSDPRDVLGLVCERAGISTRAVYRWRHGESDVTLAVADSILTRLDLCWWDIWDEESLRIPVLTVRIYGHRRGRGLVYTHSRVHGDLGPDTEALARVQALFEGDDTQVAA